MESQQLGAAITYYREKEKMTMVDLAVKAELSQSAISMYESGKRTPSEKALESIAKALGVSVSEINKTALFENFSTYNDFRMREHEVQMLNRGSDLLFQFTKDLVLTANIRFRDLRTSGRRRGNLRRRRPDSYAAAIAEEAVLSFLEDHKDELAERINQALHETNVDLHEIVEELRSDE